MKKNVCATLARLAYKTVHFKFIMLKLPSDMGSLKCTFQFHTMLKIEGVLSPIQKLCLLFQLYPSFFFPFCFVLYSRSNIKWIR